MLASVGAPGPSAPPGPSAAPGAGLSGLLAGVGAPGPSAAPGPAAAPASGLSGLLAGVGAQSASPAPSAGAGGLSSLLAGLGQPAASAPPPSGGSALGGLLAGLGQAPAAAAPAASSQSIDALLSSAAAVPAGPAFSAPAPPPAAAPTAARPTIPAPTAHTDLSALAPAAPPAFPERGQFPAASAVSYSAANGPLQPFIAALAPYTVVQLAPGEYSADLTIQQPLYLKGDGQAQLTGTGATNTVTCAGEFVVLDGLGIAAGPTDRGGAVAVSAGFARLVNCRATASAVSAVLVGGSAFADIHNSDFFGSQNPPLFVTQTAAASANATCLHGSKSHGFAVQLRGALILTNSKIYENAGAGGMLKDEASLFLSQCDITANGQVGIQNQSSGHVQIENTAIHDQPGAGILVGGQGRAYIGSTRIAACAQCALQVVDQARVRCVGNEFLDADERTTVVQAQGSAILQLNRDRVGGKGMAALGAIRGRIECTDTVIANLPAMAALVQEGTLLMKGGGFSDIGKTAVQVQRGSVELVGVTIDQAGGRCILGNEFKGIASGCKFTNFKGVAIDISRGAEIAVVDSEFTDGALAATFVRDGGSAVFSRCKFLRPGQAAADMSGAGAAAVFEDCEIRSTGTAGIGAKDGVRLTVIGGSFADISKIGVNLGGAGTVGIIDGVDFSGCGHAAVAAGSGANLSVANTVIHDNANFGAQVCNAPTVCTITKTRFLDSGGAGLFAAEQATVNCNECIFTKTNSPHVCAQDGGRVVLTACDISAAKQGTGLQASKKGALVLNGTQVHNEGRIGIFIAPESTLEATNSEIRECGSAGLYVQASGEAKLVQCRLVANGQIGIQLEGGTVTAQQCTISNHTGYGVYVCPGAVFNDDGSSYQGNRAQDVRRQ
jgi:hypothetical protein